MHAHGHCPALIEVSHQDFVENLITPQLPERGLLGVLVECLRFDQRAEQVQVRVPLEDLVERAGQRVGALVIDNIKVCIAEWPNLEASPFNRVFAWSVRLAVRKERLEIRWMDIL